MINVVILGLSGNAIDILDALLAVNDSQKSKIFDFKGFLDDDPKQVGKKVHGYEVLGPIDDSRKMADCQFVLGFGSTKSFRDREKTVGRLELPIERFETIIHPSAQISRFSEVGRGVVILQQVTLANNARIGNHVLILPHSILSHDCKIGDYSCIAGGVCVSGGAHIGKGCYLGSNSSLISNVQIGDGALIGMGAVVLKAVAAQTVLVGNPGRELSH